VDNPEYDNPPPPYYGCIFVFGFLSMAKPVRGYKFGVPEIAKGMETEGQVILYDEEEWNNHLGVGADNPDDYFGGDADVVGAKSKAKIIDWEEEEIPFFSDFVLTVDVEFEDIPEITDLNSVLNFIYDAIHALGDPESEINAVYSLFEGVNATLGWGDLDFSQSENKIKGYVVRNGSIANDLCSNYSMDHIYVNKKYAEKLDGVLLEIKTWDLTTEKFDDKPDDLVEGPFLEDPHEWYNIYKRLKVLESELLAKSDRVINSIYAFNDSFAYLRKEDFASWSLINQSIADFLSGGPPDGLEIPLPRRSEGGDDFPSLILDAALNPTGENPLQQGTQALLAIRDIIDEEIPEKFNFFFALMMEGLPTYTPTDKYLREVIDDFDIDGTVPETNIIGLNDDLIVYGDVELDGTVITLKFEYPENTKDPDNPDKELKDWEIVIAYGEQGGAGGKVFRDSKTGKVFYDTEGLGWLPEYEINIIVGISTLFIIGLIYAVLIRRKTEHKFLDKLRGRKR